MDTGNDNRPQVLEMNDSDIEAFLNHQGHGVLSLTNDGAAYGIPVSFGYDDQRVFFTFITFGEDSMKADFVQQTDSACLTAYETRTRFVWRSAVLHGEVTPIDPAEKEYVEDILEDNAWFPSLFPPTAPITDVQLMELRINEMSGRKVGEFE